jgi:hypothetical protein
VPLGEFEFFRLRAAAKYRHAPIRTAKGCDGEESYKLRLEYFRKVLAPQGRETLSCSGCKHRVLMIPFQFGNELLSM